MAINIVANLEANTKEAVRQVDKVNEKVKTITVSDYYDYSVEDDSIISDQKKKIAVKIASTKALSNIFSRIAVQNMKEVE